MKTLFRLVGTAALLLVAAQNAPAQSMNGGSPSMGNGGDNTVGIQGNSSVGATGYGATGNGIQSSGQVGGSQYQYNNSGPGYSAGDYGSAGVSGSTGTAGFGGGSDGGVAGSLH
jgi:hypothetical protein